MTPPPLSSRTRLNSQAAHLDHTTLGRLLQCSLQEPNVLVRASTASDKVSEDGDRLGGGLLSSLPERRDRRRSVVLSLQMFRIDQICPSRLVRHDFMYLVRFLIFRSLMEWLNHSQKKHCELCKTPFQFTNLYDPAMPKRLPVDQMMRKLLSDVRKAMTLTLRWTLVSFVWLAWLPYCTRHIWRSSIKIGDQLTSNSSGHLHDLANMTLTNSSSVLSNYSTPSTSNTTLIIQGSGTATFLPLTLSNLTRSTTLNRLLVEIFEGQIITAIIIVVFVVVFLIREWIVQNNANLLDESTEFLNALAVPPASPPPDEGRRRAMRLQAGPASPELADNVRDLFALSDQERMALLESSADSIDTTMDREPQRTLDSFEERINFDNVDSRVDYADNNRGFDGDEDVDMSTPSLANSVSSDWDTLRAQAAGRPLRGKSQAEAMPDMHSPSIASENDDAVGGLLGPSTISEAVTNDVLTSSADTKALRRQAVLRATTHRLEQDHVGTSTATDHEGHGTQSERQSRSRLLDERLASDHGQSSPQELRERRARQRSVERQLWENSVELGGEDYPNSPLPVSRPDRYMQESLEPPEAFDLDYVERDAATNGSTRNAFRRREIEIAATSPNPQVSTSQSGSSLMRQSSPLVMPEASETAAISIAQVEVLLEEIRRASTPHERTIAADAAIQVCIDIARMSSPASPLARTDPVYRDTIKHVGTIAMVANQLGIERALDVQRAFRLAEDMHSEPTSTSPGVVIPDTGAVDVVAAAEIHELQDIAGDAEVALNAARDDMDEDIDGLLELIGVRGPVLALLQNSMLVVVMVTSFIVFGICVPHMCGRSVMAIFKDPQRYLVEMPFAITRTVLHQFSLVGNLTLRGAKILSMPIKTHSRVVKYGTMAVERTVGYMRLHGSPSWQLPGSIISGKSLSTKLVTATSILQSLLRHLMDVAVLDVFVENGTTLPEKLMTVSCGYLTFISLGALYLKTNQRLTTGEQGKHIELVARSFLRQAGFVIKFMAILGIELVAFPFYCGLLLDAVFVPFFIRATLQARLQFFSQFPFTSLFLHWVVGTVYMFNFALFVSMCREIVRPGLLFFIRDPNDPAFNPIKDILERSIRSQMRKIGISILIYGALIVVAFGSVVWALAYAVQSILPLHWSTAEPLFEVPFDLLLFQILLPLTYRYIKPHQKLKHIWSRWFEECSRAFRLTSFIMGERVADEEGHLPGRSGVIAQAWFRSPNPDDPRFVKDGSFRRVPATDSLPMRKGKDMIMLVSEDNHLLHDVDEIDDTQDDTNYTVVYAPPKLRFRLYLFMISMWAFAAVLCVSCSVLPLVVGRQVFRSVSPQTQMHDLFAFLYGVYALGFLVVGGSKAVTLVRAVTTQYTNLVHRPGQATPLLRSILGIGIRWLYLLTTLSVIIPVLLGLALETYVIVPLGLWLNTEYSPTVHLAHDWIVGLVYVKIIGRTALAMPNNVLADALNNTMRNDWRRGWRNPDLGIATKRLILPITAALSAALIMPLSIGALARYTLYWDAPEEVILLLYRMCYPAALLSAMLLLVLKGAFLLGTRWRATVRDTLYLKGRQLHNFGEQGPPPPARSADPPQVAQESFVTAHAAEPNTEVDSVIEDVLEDIVQQIENEGFGAEALH